jgi:hypothetical protein
LAFFEGHMSDPTTAQRLAFHGFSEAEDAPPMPLPPAVTHRLHGGFPVATDEIRVTSQSARRKPNGRVDRGRIIVRRWCLNPDGTWWPDSALPGVVIYAENAVKFGAAVAAAVAALAGDVKP